MARYGLIAGDFADSVEIDCCKDWLKLQVSTFNSIGAGGRDGMATSGDNRIRSNRLIDRTNDVSTVAILLCTMQGGKYLHEQLDSIIAQSHRNWSVWASDDGSNDETHSTLEQYSNQLGKDRLSIHFGPTEGFVANFLSLTCNANISADYYAYADQDDIWEVDKLERSLEWLNSVPSHIPALYCARTVKVNATNKVIGYSPLYSRPPSFANALVQNIGGGNTMVFNDAARQVLRKAGASVQVVSHDWWAYMVVTGCGGQVFYDPRPTVRYRQHDKNLVGANSSNIDQVHRIWMLLGGRFVQWNDRNTSALLEIKDSLTSQAREQLQEFVLARKSGFFSRFRSMRKSGVYRQTVLGNLALLIATLMGKI